MYACMYVCMCGCEYNLYLHLNNPNNRNNINNTNNRNNPNNLNNPKFAPLRNKTLN